MGRRRTWGSLTRTSRRTTFLLTCEACGAQEAVSQVPIIWSCRSCKQPYQLQSAVYGPKIRHKVW
jgi:hypothetical protein